MMRPDSNFEKVYLYPKSVDFRMSIDGLAALAELDIKVPVFDPVLFVFLDDQACSVRTSPYRSALSQGNPMLMRFDPPTRITFIAVTYVIPVLVMLALWMQDDLTNLTVALTLAVTATLFFRMESIQNLVRAKWQREYDQKLAATDAALARGYITVPERRRLQRYRNQLANRYHLVTSPAITYKPISVMGYVLKFSIYAFKN